MIKVTSFSLSLSSFSVADISRISYYAGEYMHVCRKCPENCWQKYFTLDEFEMSVVFKGGTDRIPPILAFRENGFAMARSSSTMTFTVILN